ncbi:Esterase/lipase-like protein (plasmid) [Novosphingobium aromaticivorans DSM 12444]|uniref:Esterase/lipase-like protein n=1 Tax=Novosphingobium aromaticivorans (strain ATCC 700278 / DSM 12444 / CCUG 56034 / CIP 105152 / NBRC 16084 / F199) TaxID=279238 RepID=A4XEB6_NOVAD|nr:alpha/beta hydrolase [Novosphingobium aromaticivorans]ABP64277.1 Esterase/lipase-like protein [Novosphingobium aromaticivorans DSM 12444]SCY80924.1 Acetyl esterase/lipase [Novosphingobium aromaticivorans]
MDPRDAIASMGNALGPQVVEACRALFDDEQRALAARVPVLAADCVYGPHERQRLDLYRTASAGALPVVLFVHGGGFRLGDKGHGGGDSGSWQNAAVARTMAEAGFLGAAMNYRLLPDARWPDGGEDVIAAVEWLRANAAGFGGDPTRIFVVGTSAGAVHIATAIMLRPDLPVVGAVLLSGLYGHTPLDDRDEGYYGPQADYAARMPREAVASTTIPLFIACAEHDPPRFQAEFLGLMRDRLERQGAMPAGTILSGHNHYSMAMHIGTGDRRLADEITGFILRACR